MGGGGGRREGGRDDRGVVLWKVDSMTIMYSILYSSTISWPNRCVCALCLACLSTVGLAGRMMDDDDDDIRCDVVSDDSNK